MATQQDSVVLLRRLIQERDLGGEREEEKCHSGGSEDAVEKCQTRLLQVDSIVVSLFAGSNDSSSDAILLDCFATKSLSRASSTSSKNINTSSNNQMLSAAL